MQLDWLHFTPWLSLVGGVLIGVAAAMLILLNGRIAGISGIVGGLLTPRRLHQRPRRVRALAPVAALARRYRRVHGRRHAYRVHRAARAMSIAAAFAAGLLFGIGLILSGMTDPGKVIGFLDFFGNWDPSLAFVMAGAILVGFFAFAFARRRTRTFLGGALHLPQNRDIDNRLVGGSLVFGIGWGLAGYCPGPALVSFGSGQEKAAIFVAAMLGGMLVYTALERFVHEPRRRTQRPA
jgi:uncharacterized membrane protein YedE/YeeE